MIYTHIYKVDKEIKTISKQLLKENLAKYLNTNNFNISTNDNGKPTTTGINFSISHSKNMLVQVFNFENEIGVDVEFINSKRKYLKLAQRYFHPQEYDFLTSLETQNACKLFYTLWTTKESLCKAKGGRLWCFLRHNCLDKNNLMVNFLKETSIIQSDKINQFSLSLATFGKLETIKYV